MLFTKNNYTKQEARAFVAECERVFDTKIDIAVSVILEKNTRFICLSGPSCAGKTTTAKKIVEKLAEHNAVMNSLREYLIKKLDENEYTRLISPTLPEKHAPHIINLTLPRIKSETMLHFLSADGIFVSSGSACSSHAKGPSGALVAFGLPAAEADCSLRVSLSEYSTKEDIDALVASLSAALARLVRIK